MKRSAAFLAVAPAVVTAAQSAVRKVALTLPVRSGDYASLTVSVSPSRHCTIEVGYATIISPAKRLGAKTGARITYRWRVGSHTTPGRWPIIVRCGTSGTLRTTLRCCLVE